MAAAPSQTFANHGRYVPLYHFALGAILAANLVFTIVHVARHPTLYEAWIGLAMAVGFLIIFWYARDFAKTVQDRVIRLEETLRMERLLPPDLKSRIGELTVRQLVGLRFASDAELVTLVRRALDERLDQRSIKQSVQHWRPDHLRA